MSNEPDSLHTAAMELAMKQFDRITELEAMLAAQNLGMVKLIDDVERCYRMLLSEANAKGALFKAENILREALTDARESQAKREPVRLTDEQIEELWRDEWDGFVIFEEACVIARAIESAAHRKNGWGE